MVKTSLYWKSLEQAHPQEHDICLVMLDDSRVIKSVWHNVAFSHVSNRSKIVCWTRITTPSNSFFGMFVEMLRCYTSRLPVVRTIRRRLHAHRVAGVMNFLGVDLLEQLLLYQGWSVQQEEDQRVYRSPDGVAHFVFEDHSHKRFVTWRFGECDD
jgi:hypothetical protein